MAEQDSPRKHAPKSDAPKPHMPKSLQDAAWLKRPETRAVFAALSGDGVETRAVGGAVRDALLGLDVTDVDFATTAAPDKVMALARNADLKAIPTGIAHGTVTVVADGMSFEVTTLRRDVETYGRHAKVAFTEDWAEDAKRRDFTLNALYAGSEGTLYDPLDSYEDLAAGRVRFIGDARRPHRGGLLTHPPLLPLQRLLRPQAARPRGSCGLRARARRLGAAFCRADLGRAQAHPRGARGDGGYRGPVRIWAADRHSRQRAPGSTGWRG